MIRLTKNPELDAQRKRQNIQTYFWGIVGSAEHINIPKLEAVIRKEFHTSDHRLIKAQIRLMQTEGRIRVQDTVKVWIKQPSANLNHFDVFGQASSA
jgi:hypothetical protein